MLNAHRTKYATEKGIQAVTEFNGIIQPYLDEIFLLNEEIKKLQQLIPKKQRVKIIKKKKK